MVWLPRVGPAGILYPIDDIAVQHCAAFNHNDVHNGADDFDFLT
ncbi:MAG: hypothetical protein OEO77_13915 [Acidimicrobiia bacterium]|nr:hypothetical protein [Acidimicrobiia bacterium]